MGLGDRIMNRLEELGTSERDQAEIEPVIERAKGESVRSNDLLKIMSGGGTVPFDLIDEGEQPHYLLKGTTIDVEGHGAGSESIIGWDRDRRIGNSYTVITEDRVLIIASHLRGFDEHTIPYDSITNVNLNSGLTSTRLSIQTKSATYHLSVTQTKQKQGVNEIQDAVKYIRDRRNRENNSNTTSDDPLDRIEKLKSLHEDGVLSDEEFEEKKESLLDEV